MNRVGRPTDKLLFSFKSRDLLENLISVYLISCVTRKLEQILQFLKSELNVTQ